MTQAARPLPAGLDLIEYRGTAGGRRLTMLEAIREVLTDRMKADPRVSLFGEDIEDPKGDVFGVTKGLSTAFTDRVVNAPLSESTIVGMSIGRALAGEHPVAMIQFADFLPLAFNQIISELGSMFWRTNGGWQCPVIIMAACGGYRPGLGPFHAQTLESVLAHVPGVDVLMPSSAGDAAGLLNMAFRSGRPTIFLYPKSCLNDRDRTTSADVDRQLVPLGKARRVSRGNDLTIVTWGSTVSPCREVVAALEGVGLGVDLLDLRTIAPWDHETVTESARRTGKLIVVHEDNRTCGFGGEVIATIVEALGTGVICRRVVRPDSFVPCNYVNQLEILPSFSRVLEVAADMLDVDLSWDEFAGGEADHVSIEARGSSPADQSVTVVEWKVRPGDSIRSGQTLAELESDKSVYELAAPVDGRVDDLLISEGTTVRIGTPVRLRSRETDKCLGHLGRPVDPVPRLRRRSRPSLLQTPRSANGLPGVHLLGISAPSLAVGADTMTNTLLAERFPTRSMEEILRITGIASRPRLAPHESALSLAVAAARDVLNRESLSLRDIDLLICSSTAPASITPSTACLVLHALNEPGGLHEVPAYDLSAACTGFLYALTAGYDFLHSHPDSIVLVVTADGMSRVVDPTDFDTAVVFGDAASATVLYGAHRSKRAWALLRRPVISASGEDGRASVSAPTATGTYA